MGVTRTTPVGGHRIITGLIPTAAIPDEILTDHPQRFRAMVVESSNPVHSLPDSSRMREALEALDLKTRQTPRASGGAAGHVRGAPRLPGQSSSGTPPS